MARATAPNTRLNCIRLGASVLALVAGLVLPAGSASAASGSVSFSSSYAVSGSSYGSGSLSYTSGAPNYLRATATGSIVQVLAPYLAVVAIRQGTISSSTVRYTGATNGRINWSVNGNFVRSLSGGFGALDGIMFTHEIIFELQDATAGHVIGSYTMTDVNVLCGGLVWPIAPAACNSAASDTYPAKFNLYTAGGSGQIVNGHAYREIVMVATVIQGEGVGFGLEATTTASSISGSLSW